MDISSHPGHVLTFLHIREGVFLLMFGFVLFLGGGVIQRSFLTKKCV